MFARANSVNVTRWVETDAYKNKYGYSKHQNHFEEYEIQDEMNYRWKQQYYARGRQMKEKIEEIIRADKSKARSPNFSTKKQSHEASLNATPGGDSAQSLNNSPSKQYVRSKSLIGGGRVMPTL